MFERIQGWKSIMQSPESMTPKMMWAIIKAVAVHLGADYGTQSEEMASRKNDCLSWRLAHIAMVGAAHTASAATCNASGVQRIEYVAFQTLSHFVIDSVKIPKWLDQIAHLTIAIYGAYRWLGNDKRREL